MSLDLRELPELKQGKKPVLPAVLAVAIRELFLACACLSSEEAYHKRFQIALQTNFRRKQRECEFEFTFRYSNLIVIMLSLAMNTVISRLVRLFWMPFKTTGTTRNWKISQKSKVEIAGRFNCFLGTWLTSYWPTIGIVILEVLAWTKTKTFHHCTCLQKRFSSVYTRI